MDKELYDKFIRKVSAVFKEMSWKSNGISDSVDDFVQNILVQIIESNLPISWESFNIFFKKQITTQCLDTLNSQVFDLQSLFCKSCMDSLPIAAFGFTTRNNGKHNITQSYCKPCINAKMRDYYEKNRELQNEREREYMAANKEKVKKYRSKKLYKETQAAYHKEWQDKNKDKYNEYRRQWRFKKKGKV